MSEQIKHELPDQQRLSEIYPNYYKATDGATAIDVYAVCKMFCIDDTSGALQHSIKKLLLSGVRTGGKSKFKDVTEARDTLNRWLDLHAAACTQIGGK